MISPNGPGFLDGLLQVASRSPGAPALLAPGCEPLTFEGLWIRIESVARILRQAGIERDDVVAVSLPDGPELISLFLGIASAAVCAPINPGFREGELEFCLADLGARALIVDQEAASPARTAGARLGIPVLDVIPSPESAAPVATSRGDTALLLHTSGTTGKPRLVPLTHSNLLSTAACTRHVLELSDSDRFLSMMPLFHLQGLVSVIAQLQAGGTVISTAGFDAASFPAWLEQYRPTWYTAGPALHSAILSLAQASPDVLRRFPLRFARSIGAPLPESLLADLEAALHAPVLEGYGMTETGLITSNALPPRLRKQGSVGQSAGAEVAITGDSGESLPPGLEGEIVVRGPSVLRAYRNNPEANQAAFRDGWFRTGDLGRLDSDGFLFITGRVKDIINRGGEKILPREVDETLASHPAVSEAAAFGVPDERLGEDIAAAVVLDPGAEANETEIRRFAASRLARFKIPRRIHFLESIPKGPTGKPLRQELRERFRDPGNGKTDFIAPSTPVECELAAIWQRFLNVEQVGIRDDFFSLGGDSLSLTLLLMEIETEFGVDQQAVEESDFFVSSTIETLARLVPDSPRHAGARSRKSSMLALQPGGSRTPFFCFPGADENPYYFLALSKHLGQDQPFIVIRDPRSLEERGIYTVEDMAARFSALIRSRQPEGPYVLGGHCYGGVVAFEVARQLISDGEEVAAVVLFEVPTPGYPKVLRHWKSYVRQIGHLLSGARISFDDARRHFQVLTRLFRSKSAVAARRAGLNDVFKPAEQINFRNRDAARSYRPGPLACEVVQFIAADEQHSTLILDDTRLGWREFAAGFTVRTTPGKAADIFREPHVRELAVQLRDVLVAQASEAAEKVRKPLADARGSVTRLRIYTHLPSRDREGAAT